MSLFRSKRPVICKVHGFAVAGGSDIALCSDMIVMAEDARIGYPPVRVWGCPTTAMWVYRLGAEKAKRMLFTGDKITGVEAAALGLVLKAVPADRLDDEVDALAHRMATVPQNQLMMQKLMVNQALYNMGLMGTQMIATVFDGITRHSPEGLNFKRRSEADGLEARRRRARPGHLRLDHQSADHAEQVIRSAGFKSTERVPLYLIVMVIFCETTGGLNGKWSASPSTSWSVCLPGGSSIRASVWPAPK